MEKIELPEQNVEERMTCIGKFELNGELLRTTASYNQIAKLFAFFKIVPIRVETLWYKYAIEYIALSDTVFYSILEGDVIPEYNLTIMNKIENNKPIIDLENTHFKRIK